MQLQQRISVHFSSPEIRLVPLLNIYDPCFPSENYSSYSGSRRLIFPECSKMIAPFLNSLWEYIYAFRNRCCKRLKINLWLLWIECNFYHTQELEWVMDNVCISLNIIKWTVYLKTNSNWFWSNIFFSGIQKYRANHKMVQCRWYLHYL